MKQTRFHRRHILRAVGTVTIGSLWGTMQTAADQHLQTFEAPLRAAGGVQTNASGTATVRFDTETCEGRYAIHVDCIRNATKITIRISDSVVRERALEGAVTEGLVRDEIIAQGAFTENDLEEYSAADFVTALREEEVTISVHTEKYPEGELEGRLGPVDEPTIDLRDEGGDDTEEADDDRAEFYLFELTFQVVDEDGNPVEGELVERRPGGHIGHDWIEVGTTDENGEIVLTAASSFPDDEVMVDVRVRDQTTTVSIGLPEQRDSIQINTSNDSDNESSEHDENGDGDEKSQAVPNTCVGSVI